LAGVEYFSWRNINRQEDRHLSQAASYQQVFPFILTIWLRNVPTITGGGGVYLLKRIFTDQGRIGKMSSSYQVS
jgi:hypothetical protein